MPNRFFAIASTLALIAGTAAMMRTANAQITQTNAGGNSAFTVPAASANLLNQAAQTGTVASIGSEGTATSVNVLVNGAFGAASVDTTPGEAVTIGDGSVLTYTFGTPARITEIDTFTGWRDAGRVDQAYQISLALATSPGTFTAFDTVSYQPSASNFFDSSVRLTPATGATLATNVSAIRFSFPTTQNGFVGYRELSVLGSTAAPEPTTGALALAAIGFIPAIAGRFRRR